MNKAELQATVWRKENGRTKGKENIRILPS